MTRNQALAALAATNAGKKPRKGSGDEEMVLSLDTASLLQGAELRAATTAPGPAAPFNAKRLAALLGNAELAAHLADVHQLHPIRAMSLSPLRARFLFASPVPWALFVRMDIAAPFSKASAELAHRLGVFSVRAFAFGDGIMRAEIV